MSIEPNIEDIYDKIHIELKNNRLTKAQLADFIGISREHFTRIFGKKDLSNLQLVNYPPTQSDGMGFKPEYECKEQYIVDFLGIFTDAPSKEIF